MYSVTGTPRKGSQRNTRTSPRLAAYLARIAEQASKRAIEISEAMLDEQAILALPFEKRRPESLAEVRAILPIGVAPEPCICGAPRWEHSGLMRSGAHPSNGCTRYTLERIEAFAWEIVHADSERLLTSFRKWQRQESPRNPILSGQLSVRPSDVGGCHRKVWYRNFPPADYTPEPTDERAATMGNIIHDGVLHARSALYPWREHEKSVAIPGLDREGKIDEWDPMLGVVADVKTVGDRRFDGAIRENGPDESMWAQVLIYALALVRLGLTVRVVRLLCVDRDNGHEEVFQRAFDGDAAHRSLSELTNLADTLDDYRQAVADGDLDLAASLVPDRPEYARDHKSFPCGWCPARMHCWNVEQAKAIGRSPESLTLLGPDPADAAIELVLRDYADARTAKSAAGKDQEAAKAMLDGIPERTYGGMEYGHTTAWTQDVGRYIRDLQSAYTLPDGLRPDVDAITRHTRPEERIRITPVRAAKREATATRAKRAAKHTSETTAVDAPAEQEASDV